MKLRIIFLTLLMIVLVGCFNKSITPQVIHYPKTTRSGIKYSVSNNDLRKNAWWKKLNDPKLNGLIAKALSCNNEIKASLATIEQAQAQLKATKYSWLPTLDANANGFSGGTWNSHTTPHAQLANTPFLRNFSPVKFNGYATGFVPGYNLNILSNINNVQSAKASLIIVQAQTQATQLSIMSQMAGAYFMLLSQKEQLAVENILIKQLTLLHQLEQVRFKKGASTIEAIMNINQQLAVEETKIPQIESVIAQSENTIHLLLNQNPAPISTRNSLFSLKLNNFIPEYLPSSVLKNRPDIMIALNQLKIASAKIGIAYSAFFPALSLTTFMGKASLDLTNLLKINPNIWIVQGAASLKILNGSAFQNIKSAKAEFKSLYYTYLKVLRSAFVDVDDALTTAQNNKLSYQLMQQGYFAAKTSYNVAFTQYKSGARDYRAVVNAHINLLRTKLNLIQEKAQLLDSMVQVYNAVGAGYDAR